MQALHGTVGRGPCLSFSQPHRAWRLQPLRPSRLPACVHHGMPHGIQRRRRAGHLRGAAFEGAIPEGVQLEVKDVQEGEGVEWNAETKTLRLPISVIKGSGERRTKLVVFTCNKCGGRTARNVNPLAWEQGVVMGQCATCEVWHVLSAKNKDMYEEIRYKDNPDYPDIVGEPLTAASTEPGPGSVP